MGCASALCEAVTCQNRSCACCLPTTASEAKRLRWGGIFTICVAILFVIFAIFIPDMIAKTFRTTLESASILQPGSATYAVFQDNSDHPMKLELYVYNLTNSDDVLLGAQPQLQEVGPLVYWVYRQIVDPLWSHDNHNITWRYYEHYQFDNSLSAISQEDIIIQSNLPFWGAVNTLIARGLGETLNTIITMVKGNGYYQTDHEMAFSNRTIREQIFGYNDDPLLNTMHSMFGTLFSPNYTGLIVNYTSYDDVLTRLTTPDTIYTGISNRSLARDYIYYHNNSVILNMDASACPWSTNSSIDQCQVRGLDGGAIPLFKNEKIASNANITFLWPSLYRHMDLTLTNTQVMDSLKLYRFEFDTKEWSNQTATSYNSVYNMVNTGVIPLSSALGGSPISCTLPHFINVTNPSFANASSITYLPQNASHMGTFFDFESRTGATLRFQSTSQMMVDVGPVQYSFDPWFAQNVVDDNVNDADESMNQEQYQLQSIEAAAWGGSSYRPLPTILQDSVIPSCSFSSVGLFSQPPASLGVNNEDEGTTHLASCFSFLDILLQDQHMAISSANQQQFQTISPSHHSILQQYFPELSAAAATTTVQAQSPVLGETTITYFANMSSAPLPFFWGNQTGGLSQSEFDTLSRTFAAVDNTVIVLPIVFIVIAVILLAFGIFLCLRSTQTPSLEQQEQNILDTIAMENPHAGTTELSTTGGDESYRHFTSGAMPPPSHNPYNDDGNGESLYEEEYPGQIGYNFSSSFNQGNQGPLPTSVSNQGSHASSVTGSTSPKSHLGRSSTSYAPLTKAQTGSVYYGTGAWDD